MSERFNVTPSNFCVTGVKPSTEACERADEAAGAGGERVCVSPVDSVGTERRRMEAFYGEGAVF